MRAVRLLCATTLAACSHTGTALPPVSADYGGAAIPLHSGYRQLYRFSGYPSGSMPDGLIEFDGKLYGTTTGGGAKTFGTFFSRSLGETHTLYSFKGGSDGAQPEGNLVALNGVFYGTTQYGGASGDGTVFAITPAGKEHVVYAFKGGADGATPVLSGLLAFKGRLYGTTSAGGDTICHHPIGCGTVFEMTTAGQEHVLHRFKGKPDGASPTGTPIISGDTLYGTTNFGGKYENGAVFRLRGPIEHLVYSFKGFPDGATPFAGLTALAGKFYGTTVLGGAFSDAGTVFEVSASGTERVLHSFKGVPDGALPYAGLTAIGDLLYGATEFGGKTDPSCVGRGIAGCGTLFAISTSGKLDQLYAFNGHFDGAEPWSTLVEGKRALYGTTLVGGGHADGTIFELAH